MAISAAEISALSPHFPPYEAGSGQKAFNKKARRSGQKLKKTKKTKKAGRHHGAKHPNPQPHRRGRHKNKQHPKPPTTTRQNAHTTNTRSEDRRRRRAQKSESQARGGCAEKKARTTETRPRRKAARGQLGGGMTRGQP